MLSFATELSEPGLNRCWAVLNKKPTIHSTQFKTILMNLTPDNLLTPPQVAALLEVSTKTLANWRCRRTGPPFSRAGKKIWYLKDQTSTWVEQQLKTTTKQAGDDTMREKG